jgi:hypothetical protein
MTDGEMEYGDFERLNNPLPHRGRGQGEGVFEQTP